MPSTVVHLGFAALIAAALLSDHYDRRALAIVLVIAAVPDIDTFLGFWMDGAHRSVLHNVWVVVIPAIVLGWDVHLRQRSFVRRRWGSWGVRVGWVSLVAMLFGHVLLDTFHNGANVLWPLYDGFIDLDGELLLSNQEGIVQTFVDLSEPETNVRGTTNTTHYSTGIDPAPATGSSSGGTTSTPEPPPERRFPLADTGELFVLAVTGYAVAGLRFVGDRLDD